MKKAIYFLVFVVFIASFYLIYVSINKDVPDNKISITPTKSFQPSLTPRITESVGKEILSDDYKTSWIVIRDLKRLILYTNLDNKLTTKEAKDSYGCNSITSASFWKSEGGHIGLFIKDGTIISDGITSAVFNGFFWWTSDGKTHVSNTFTNSDNVLNAIQSGPILMLDGQLQEVSSQNDEQARRMVLTTDVNDNVNILTIYYAPNPLLGPKLEELPRILRKINDNTSLDFKNAINLDGGAHSSFISDDLTLTEVSPVGAFLCVLP